RYASERAAATGETHALAIDLEKQRFRLEHEVDLEPEAPATRADSLRPPSATRGFEPVPATFGRWTELNVNRVGIEKVQPGPDAYKAQTVRIGFGSDGSADDAVVSLLDTGGRRRTVRVLPFTGEVKLRDGGPDDD